MQPTLHHFRVSTFFCYRFEVLFTHCLNMLNSSSLLQLAICGYWNNVISYNLEIEICHPCMCKCVHLHIHGWQLRARYKSVAMLTLVLHVYAIQILVRKISTYFAIYKGTRLLNSQNCKSTHSQFNKLLYNNAIQVLIFEIWFESECITENCS